MSSLRMVEAKLPPGFRFHPRDDELVCDYLLKKWSGSQSPLLTDVDLNKCEPWDIPERACIGGKEWYFYSQRDRKYATGLRTNRATVSGYWKATGKDRAVVRRGSLVGMRKTLVFYQGRAPKGTKTQWVMHEFRLEAPLGFGFGSPKLSPPSKEDWVLCRVFFKNKEDGPPKSGTDDNDSNDNSLEDTRGSSSSSSAVAPKKDSYITFEQSRQPNADTHHHQQQVPCFSIYSGSNNQNNNTSNLNPTNNNNPILFPQNYNMNLLNNNNNNAKNSNCNQGSPRNMGGSILTQNDDENEELAATINLNPVVGCDKKVLEAVLSHLTKIKTMNNEPPSSLMEPLNSDTYFSEPALQHPTMWNHF